MTREMKGKTSSLRKCLISKANARHVVMSTIGYAVSPLFSFFVLDPYIL
jgi:hypothetical protein